MVKIRKDTELKDARRMRKEWGTGEKEFGNLLDKKRKQGSKHIVSRFETKRDAYELCFCRCRIGCPPHVFSPTNVKPMRL